MTKLIQFLASNPDIEFVGVRWHDNAAIVFAHYKDGMTNFRVQNVGDVDRIIHFLRGNPECASVKFRVLHDGTVHLRALAGIADEPFEIEGYINPPEPDEVHVPAMLQLETWLDNFAKKLADVRRKFSLQHA